MKLIIVILAVISFTGCIDRAHIEAELTVSEQVKKGHSYLNKGLYEKAIHEFDQVLGTASDRTDRLTQLNRSHAYASRGEAYKKMKDLDKAISDFNQAIEINPSNVVFYMDRALAYYNQKSFDLAISDIDKALKLNTDKELFSDLFAIRGISYLRKEDLNSAISDFDEAIKFNRENSSAYSGRAESYFYSKKYDEAWNDVRKARELGLQFDPRFIEDLKKESGKDS